MKHCSILVLIFVLSCINSAVADGHVKDAPRKATIDEVRQLFDLTKIAEADNFRIAVLLESASVKITNGNVSPVICDSNKTVKAVQEWRSGNNFRHDETVISTSTFVPGTPGEYECNYIDFDYTNTSRQVRPNKFVYAVEINNREQMARKYLRDNIWPRDHLEEATTVFTSTAHIVQDVFLNHDPVRGLSDIFDENVNVFDPRQAEKMINGTEPDLKMTVQDGDFDGYPATRFQFTRKERRDFKPPNNYLVEWWIGQIEKRIICFQESVTNDNKPTFFVAKRSKFDAQGNPAVCETSEVNQRGDLLKNTFSLKEIETDPHFEIDKVFVKDLPANFRVYEVSWGGMKQIQWPPSIRRPRKPVPPKLSELKEHTAATNPDTNSANALNSK